MYKLNGTNSVKKLADGAYIPFIDGNMDYEEYKLWLAEGNTPEPEFTEEELKLIEVKRQTSEATQYLSGTDWVETYKLRHDLGLELIPKESSKLVIINKREEYKLFLKNLEGGN